MKTALSICLMIVLAGLAGCMYPNPPRIMMIDAALIQPAEMPFGWSFSWGVEDIQGCHRRYRMFEQSDDMPFMQHLVYDCPTVAAARAVFAAQQKPAGPGRRVVMGEGQRPASADEYAAWCDTIGADPERFCKTLARYDRIVSRMEVNRMTDNPVWPTEVELLKWTIERNDAKLVKAANTP